MEQLPPDLLLRVAQALNSRSLAHASVACSWLRQAAAAARSSISISDLALADDARLPSLRAYLLAGHAPHITSLSLSGRRICLRLAAEAPTVQDLPAWQQLRNLSLSYLDVLGAGTPQQPGILHSVGTALTRLSIRRCHVGGRAAQNCAAIAQLTGLQHLELCHSTGMHVPGSVLTALQHLTHLQLVLAPCDVGMLSQLSGLQELRLGLQETQQHGSAAVPPSTAAAPAAAEPPLEHAGPGLRQLRVLFLRHGSLDVNSTSMPFLTQLRDLEQLVVCQRSRFDPGGWLGACRRLRHLELTGVELAPGGMSGLLAQLQQLQMLTCLKLELEGCTAPPPAYAALTASSLLEVLDVSWWDVPCEVWDSMFPAGRQLAALKRMRVVEEPPRPALDMHQADESDSLHGAALARLAACCGGLQSLELLWHTDDGDDDMRAPNLTPLAQLTALTSLVVNKVTGGACGALAQLTRLAKLDVLTSRFVSVHDVAGFTALAQLTALDIECSEGRYFVSGGLADVHLKNKAGRGQPPDVAAQLARECSAMMEAFQVEERQYVDDLMDDYRMSGSDDGDGMWGM